MVVVGESSTTGMLARLATYDRTWHHRDHLHSLLASAVAAEGRKVAYHERTLAILLGLRHLHACLHMWDHIVMRSALKRLKVHCTDAASHCPPRGAAVPSARSGKDTPVHLQADPVAALRKSSPEAIGVEVADSTMSLAPSTNKPKRSSSWCPQLRFMRLPDRQESCSPQSSAAPAAPQQLQSYPELLVPSASMQGVPCSRSIADSLDIDNQDLFLRDHTPVQMMEGLHSAVIRGTSALSETSSSWDSAQTIPNLGGQAVHSSSMRPSVEPSACAESSLVLQRNHMVSADLQVSCNGLAASSTAGASLSTRAIDTSTLDEAVDVAGGPLSVSTRPGDVCAVAPTAMSRQFDEMAVVSGNLAARANRGSAEEETLEAGYVHENADSRRSSSKHGLSHFTTQRLPVSLRQVAQRRTAAAVALGVSKDAGRRTIRQAFRQNALQLHPDKGGSSADFQVLNEAYRKMACG